jgi:hypothetical protein
MNAFNSSMQIVSFGFDYLLYKDGRSSDRSKKSSTDDYWNQCRELPESLKWFMDDGSDVLEVRSECPSTTTAETSVFSSTVSVCSFI